MSTRLKTVSQIGEAGVIRRIQRLAGPPPPGVVGIGDDAAVLPRSAGRMLWTTDAMVEGTHFRTDWSRPQEVGRKALHATLSDAAAMGGAPRTVLVALSLPGTTPVAAVERLFRGLVKAARESEVSLVGGNVARARKISLSLTLLGEFPYGEPRLRDGAAPGDSLYVTGEPGWSRAGLALLKRAAKAGSSKLPDLWRPPAGKEPAWRNRLARAAPSGRRALKTYLTPEVRLRTARDLHFYRPTSLMDVSDGLAQDLHHLAEASRVALEVEAEALPRAASFRRLCAELELDPVETMLQGGEDYELVFTAGPAAAEKLGARPVLGGVPVTRIGRVVAGSPGVWLRTGGRQRPLAAKGYRHFQKR